MLTAIFAEALADLVDQRVEGDLTSADFKEETETLLVDYFGVSTTTPGLAGRVSDLLSTSSSLMSNLGLARLDGAVDSALDLPVIDDGALYLTIDTGDAFYRKDGAWVNIGPYRGPIGDQGNKGDPGGNVMAVGPFTSIAGLAVPLGTDLIQTSGYYTKGDLGHGRLVRVTDFTSKTWDAVDSNGIRWRPCERVPNVRQFGAKLIGAGVGAGHTGGFDDTPAFIAAAEAVAGGSGLVGVPAGIPAINLVHIYPGVTFQGVGRGKNTGQSAPTTNYWTAFDATKPAVQIADDTTATGVVECPGVVDALFYGENGRAAKGLIVKGGSVRGYFARNKYLDFSVTNCGLEGGSHLIAVHNIWADSSTKTNIVGATSFSLVDPVSSGDIFANDNFMSNLYIAAGNGAIALMCDSSWAFASNIKLDVRPGQVIFKKTVPGVPSRLYCSGLELDGDGSSAVMLVYGRDLTSSAAGFGNPLVGYSSVDGLMMASGVKTTGTIASGNAVLAVADATDFYAGRGVLIYGGSQIINATIKSVSGTNVTLTTNAPVAVTGGDVYVGDRTVLRGFDNPTKALSGSGLMVYDAKKTEYGAFSSIRPYLFGANGGGTVAPYNGFDVVWELGAKTLHLVMERQSDQTPDTNMVIRTGSVVSLSKGGMSANAGDLIVTWGAKEEGFSGTFEIQTAGPYTVTYNSPVSGNVTATGNIRFCILKTVKIGKGLITFPRGSGPAYDTQFGVVVPLTQDKSNSNLTLTTPDATNGVLVVGFGTALINTATAVFVISNQGGSFEKAFTVNGGGGASLGNGSNPFAKPSLHFVDAGSNSGNTLTGNNALIWNNGGRFYMKSGSHAVKPIRTGGVQAKTAAYTIVDADEGTTFTNSGTTARVDFTLPLAVGGERYTFVCMDTDGIRVIANSGDFVRVAGTASAAAGYAEATGLGASVTFEAMNGAEWYAVAVTGTWTVV